MEVSLRQQGFELDIKMLTSPRRPSQRALHTCVQKGPPPGRLLSLAHSGGQWLINEWAVAHGGLVEQQIARLHPRASGSAGLMWGKSTHCSGTTSEERLYQGKNLGGHRDQ